jgi:hypothetical protein
MPEYLLTDGPLSGRRFSTSDVLAQGEAHFVEVVDVCQHADDVPRYEYYVDRAPAGLAPGRLRLL